MRQTAPAQDHRIRPNKTVFSDFDRFRRLPAGFEIDAVGNELRTKSGEGRECANAHTRSAVDQMPAADSGVRFKNELRLSAQLMGEMATAPTWKTGDPVQLSDNRVSAEMQQVDVFAKGQVSDARVLFHDQAAGTNPGESDSTGGMNRIAELLFEQAASRRPRQQERQDHDQFLQHAGASER